MWSVFLFCSQLRHKYHQYLISAGFLAASLSSSAIVIPLLGFRVPRAYGIYLIVLYLAYLVVSIVAEIKHIWVCLTWNKGSCDRKLIAELKIYRGKHRLSIADLYEPRRTWCCLLKSGSQ